MNSFCSIILLLVAAVSSDAGNLELISKPSRGEGDVAVVKDKSQGGKYLFVNTKTGERLGDVLPPELRDARVNSIQASWSPDGSKVALVVSYGTKLNGIFLYSLRENYKMRLVEFSGVDPIKVYDKRYPNKHFSRLAEEGSGYDEDAVGDWVANDTVKIVQGVAKEHENGSTTNFLVALEVKVVGDHSKIVKLSLPGILSDEQAERFLRNWKH
jgi:hypothetical protein